MPFVRYPIIKKEFLMKKILFALLICFCIVAKSSYAGTCNGGVEFQGAVNGHTYCRSNSAMNWWTSFGWCKKQGRELASIDQLCDNWNGVSSDNVCPNMMVALDAWSWSSNPSGTYLAFSVNLSSGKLDMAHYRITGAYAVCY